MILNYTGKEFRFRRPDGDDAIFPSMGEVKISDKIVDEIEILDFPVILQKVKVIFGLPPREYNTLYVVKREIVENSFRDDLVYLDEDSCLQTTVKGWWFPFIEKTYTRLSAVGRKTIS